MYVPFKENQHGKLHSTFVVFILACIFVLDQIIRHPRHSSHPSWQRLKEREKLIEEAEKRVAELKAGNDDDEVNYQKDHSIKPSGFNFGRFVQSCFLWLVVIFFIIGAIFTVWGYLLQ